MRCLEKDKVDDIKKIPAAAFIIAALSIVHASLAAPKTREAASATVGNDGKSVRIVFEDGQDLVVVMDDSQAVQFDPPTISADRRTVAWMEEMQVAASYSDADQVYVYRDGKPSSFSSPDGTPTGMDTCPDGGVVKEWQFRANGRQLYVACGFPHGQQRWLAWSRHRFDFYKWNLCRLMGPSLGRGGAEGGRSPTAAASRHNEEKSCRRHEGQVIEVGIVGCASVKARMRTGGIIKGQIPPKRSARLRDTVIGTQVYLFVFH
jgi:hypothetical protein